MLKLTDKLKFQRLVRPELWTVVFYYFTWNPYDDQMVAINQFWSKILTTN